MCQGADQAATRAACVPLSVMDVASSTRTSTSSPECAVVSDFLHGRERVLEIRLRLTGKADDDVRSEGEVRNGRAQALDESDVTLARVRPPHRLQDATRP